MNLMDPMDPMDVDIFNGLFEKQSVLPMFVAIVIIVV